MKEKEFVEMDLNNKKDKERMINFMNLNIDSIDIIKPNDLNSLTYDEIEKLYNYIFYVGLKYV